MKRFMSVALAITVSTLLTTPTLGQRRGPFVAAGGALAFGNVDCTFCTSGTKLAGFGFVEVGGAPSDRAHVGLEASYWRGSEADTTREYFKVTANVHLYPNPDIPFSFKAGFGAGRYAEVSGDDELSSNGFVFDVGAQYDFPLSQRFSVGPFVTYSVAPDQRAKRNKIGLSSRLELTLLRFGGRVRWQ